MVIAQGRPKTGVGSSFSKEILLRIYYYRGLHPKWGAKTILSELIEKDKYPSDDLPSKSTIEGYLKSLSLSGIREKHRPLEGEKLSKLSKVKHCHDCWQMDDKGIEYYAGVGEVGTINIKDVKSCVHVQSFPLPFAHKRCHPSMSDYQCALRLAFCEYGMPKWLQADHGSNFYENKCKSPFPTPLHLWLIGLGIDLEWARIYRPTDQSKVERTHQTLHDQVQQTIPFKSWDNFKRSMDERRESLNKHIPCDSLGEPPLSAFPHAKHSTRFFNPLTEHILFDKKRIENYLNDKEWFRKVSDAKTLSLGGQVYYLKMAKPKTELKIIFTKNDKVCDLFFYDDKELIAQLPLKGIDFQNLVEPNFLDTLKTLQLEVPFDWKTMKINTTF